MATPFTLSSGGSRPLTFDEQWFLKNKNPFAPKTTLIGSPDAQVAKTFSDLQNAVNWENVNLARAMRLPGGGVSMFGGPTPSNLNFGAPNPFSTLRNTKNPDIQSAVDSVLGQVKGLTLDPNVNTNTVKSNVKDPATATRIGGAGARFDVDVNDTRQSFADFAKQFMAAQPQAQEFFNQESSAINRVFDPNGLQADLNRLSDVRQRAITTAAQRAMQNAIARTNSGRMVLGDSGYLDAQMLDAMGGIGAQAAREKSDLDRLNLLGVTDMQQRLGGQRGAMLNQLLTRGLIPIQAQQQLGGNELAQLAGLSNLTNANTFFQLDNPEAMLARRLGLIGQGSQIDLANNFYGLQKPYEPNFSGYMPINSMPSSRGFDFPMDLFGQSAATSLPAGAPGAASPPANRVYADARARYKAVTGVFPEEDANYSPEVMNWVLQHNNTNTAMRYAGNAGISPYLDPNFSEELWRN